ncbi:MAG: hypothetical protein QG641_2727 [Candidatus Poribacteria bacterium]|nr:hypothetical protein [Candidatus Poribacteria bacterium]MDQ1329437.1 hypothetical protein [Candidatus Poribacteria bacterium]
MESGIYWEVFESIGSIEAYLTFKTVESSFAEDEDGSIINLSDNQKKELVRESRIDQVLLTT